MDIKEYEGFKKELICFSGYMTQPEIKYYESGAIKTKFSIPLKKTKEDEPVWLNCVAWGKLAENISEYEKNTLVHVLGYFKTEKGKDDKEYLNFVVCFME